MPEPTGGLYRDLAGALATELLRTEPNPRAAGERAGHGWGRTLARQNKPAASAQPQDTPPIDGLIEILDHLGFTPEIVRRDDATTSLLRLRACSSAIDNQDVVYSVHLGVIHGVLAEYGASTARATLEPIAAEHACVVRIDLAPPARKRRADRDRPRTADEADIQFRRGQPAPGKRTPMTTTDRIDPQHSGPQTDRQPMIIQGGMGVGVSGWQLARAVAATGHLGVVSGVALDAVLARRLQNGDPDGTIRQALAHLPATDVAERILKRYYVAGGLPQGAPYRPTPRLGLRPNPARDELIMAGNFVEVHLAKQGHHGPVGVNYLEKIQLATPAAAYGAMLAGVDYVLMGAGIPTEIPGLLDTFTRGEPGELTLAVAGAPTGQRHTIRFDLAALTTVTPPALPRPRFLAIISSAALAAYLTRNPASTPDGFILETPVAGGHSAPPRGPMRLNADGEPTYGPRDNIDLAKMTALGLPYWLAGGHAGVGALSTARSLGAAGIQVGTAFALCHESGIEPGRRHRMIEEALAGTLVIRNEPYASPTGYPFKTVQAAGTLSDDEVYTRRPRVCDLGYLRMPYQREDGGVGYRCPAEPVASYLRKGGSVEETLDRRCLCNGLIATIGLAQHRRDGAVEPALLTLGQDLDFLTDLVTHAGTDFTAADVIAYLLAGAA